MWNPLLFVLSSQISHMNTFPFDLPLLFFLVLPTLLFLSFIQSLPRAAAPASHQHQRLRSARGGGGLWHTSVCVVLVCASAMAYSLCVNPHPQTFMCLLLIISNYFSLHLPRPLLPSLPPWVVFVIMSSYLFFRHTLLHSGESLVDVIISNNGSEVQSSLQPPFLPTLHHIQYNYCLLKIPPALTLSPVLWIANAPSPTDSHETGYVLICN